MLTLIKKVFSFFFGFFSTPSVPSVYDIAEGIIKSSVDDRIVAIDWKWVEGNLHPYAIVRFRHDRWRARYYFSLSSASDGKRMEEAWFRFEDENGSPLSDFVQAYPDMQRMHDFTG